MVKLSAPILLGLAAAAALIAKSVTATTSPDLRVLQGGKSPPPKPNAKPKGAASKKPKGAHVVVLSPARAALPADTRSSAQRAAAQPVPSDMDEGSGPLVDMDGKKQLASPTDPSIVDPWAASTKLPPPKKPKAPRKQKHPPPSAAKLSKPAKRSGKQAANDLRDYLDGGGNAGTRTHRSDFVRAAQKDMGGLTADGVYGTKTRARAHALGVEIQH